MRKSSSSVSTKLVEWYRQSHRDLPWRNTSDPYAVWVSEIMLQQTQVATVLPYYARFLEQYPSITALAQAPLDEVLKAWEGLGYYARARNLHKAAQCIVKDYGGVFPQTFEAVHALPGIGQSTAGAILTFAFKQPHAILDGNVKRVLARLYAIEQPVQEPKTADILWEKSRALLPDNPETAYDFNQAIMELGATICTPKNPECSRCPWQQNCHAFTQGRQDELPVKKPVKATPHYTIGVGVVWRDDTVLIALRPEEGLLGGLWEFPGGKCETDETIKECIRRELKEETGLEVSVGSCLAVVKHAYTHFKITLHAYQCQYVSGVAEPRSAQQLRWVTLDEIERYAFPKANKKVLESLKCHPGHQLTLC